MDKVYSEAKKIEFPWKEGAPDVFVDWLVFKGAKVVKEFVIWPLLSAISALLQKQKLEPRVFIQSP